MTPGYTPWVKKRETLYSCPYLRYEQEYSVDLPFLTHGVHQPSLYTDRYRHSQRNDMLSQHISCDWRVFSNAKWHLQTLQIIFRQTINVHQLRRNNSDNDDNCIYNLLDKLTNKYGLIFYWNVIIVYTGVTNGQLPPPRAKQPHQKYFMGLTKLDEGLTVA